MGLAKGTRLGQYEVLELIGKGGMGEVYRGYDTQLKRDVTLKVLPEEFARDRERLARFRREPHTSQDRKCTAERKIFRVETEAYENCCNWHSTEFPRHAHEHHRTTTSTHCLVGSTFIPAIVSGHIP